MNKKVSLIYKLVAIYLVICILPLISYGLLFIFGLNNYFQQISVSKLNESIIQIKNFESDKSDDLYKTVIDYARWDEMYTTAETRDQNWFKTNLTDWIPGNFNIQYILGLEKNRQTFYEYNTTGKALDAQEITKLLEKTLNNGKTTSYFSSPSGLVRLVASPITKSDGTGEKKAILVYGQILDLNYLNKTKSIFGYEADLSTITKKINTSPEYFKNINFQPDNKQGNIFFDYEDNQANYSSLFFHDLSGHPIAQLTILGLKSEYNTIKKNALISLFATIALGLILLILSCLYFLKSIVNPLSRLSLAMSAEKGQIPTKININTGDEIENLANKFNQMIDNLSIYGAEVEEKNKNIENQNKAMLNLLEDVSQERDKATREKDKTDTILSSIGDGVAVVDTEKNVIFINPAAEEMTDWKLAEATGQPIEKILDIYIEETDEKRKLPVDEALANGKVVKLANHTILKRRDKQIVPIADSAAPIKDADGKINGAVMVFRDVIRERIAEQKMVTANKELENLNSVLDQKVERATADLRKAYDELKSLDTLKDEFLNISAHELKTPLTSIIGLSELIMTEKQGEINIRQKKSLAIVNNESTRLLNIIKKILNVTRIEANKMAFDLKETDLCSIIPQVVDSLKAMAEKQKVQIVCHKPDKPIIVKVDSERIQEAIYNLIDNALKFSPPKSKIFISGETKNKQFIFSVLDQGPGIDPAKKDKLFQKFSQLDTGFARKQEGTGLGLYITKIILENMGGKIWVESEPGHGANFKFSLPLAK